MNRDYWLRQLKHLLEPVADSAMAKRGVLKAKAGYIITFHLPYATISEFEDWDILVSDPDVVSIFVRDQGQETVHKLPWCNIGSISVQFDRSKLGKNVKELATQVFLGHLGGTK